MCRNPGKCEACRSFQVSRNLDGRQGERTGIQVMTEGKDASKKWSRGCRLPFEEWSWINRNGIFEEPRLREYVAPFPPVPLMCNVSGLTAERDFAFMNYLMNS